MSAEVEIACEVRAVTRAAIQIHDGKREAAFFTAPMVHALQAGPKKRKLYAPAGVDATSPEHLAKRLANGLASAKDGECWNWTRTRNDDGYGVLRVAGRSVYAHRLAYTLGVGPIPDGLRVLHQCDNPRCINPSHLAVGTQARNVAESYERKRRPAQAQRGEENGNAKLTEVDVRSIRRLLTSGWLQRDIAARFGVSMQTISAIKRGEVWKGLL